MGNVAETRIGSRQFRDLSRVVFRVDREDPRWPDHDVVDVGGARADGYGVEHGPFGAELREHLCNFDFTKGTAVPAAGFSV